VTHCLMPVEKEKATTGAATSESGEAAVLLVTQPSDKSWETCHTIESFLYNEAVGP